jgi:hypothetical protein
MNFTVQIEFGAHAISAQVHALPRPGDKIVCAFPSAGIRRVFLVVKYVSFRQTSEFEGKECREPFGIVVFMEGDPEQRAHNEAALKEAASR